MACFSDLRSDYPLHLTLLERLYTCALTWFYIAGLTLPRTIPISLIRHNHPVPIIIYPRSCANICSSACAPSAGKSICGLTPARASVREFRLHIDEQLTTLVEHRCANLHGNTELNICELPASSLFRNSLACVVVGFRFQARTGRKECNLVLSLCVARVGGHRSKSIQIRRNTSCLKAEEQ